jgi:hypothetical protein
LLLSKPVATRRITFAGNTLGVAAYSEEAAKIIDFLYQDISDHPIADPHLTYHLHIDQTSSPSIQLYINEALLYEGTSLGAAAELLLGDSCYHLAAHSQDGLLFHAAALAWQGQGLILPGATSAGKTTLTAWLMTQGFDYLTDEMVYLPWQANHIQPLTRPLNLKSAARSILETFFDRAAHLPQLISSTHADLIPPTVLRPTNRLSEPPPALIIFPRYRPQTDFALQPLSKAQAGLELMQTLVNAKNLPDHGFSEITRLVKDVPAYKMRYANFAQIGEQIKRLLSEKQKSPS